MFEDDLKKLRSDIFREKYWTLPDIIDSEILKLRYAAEGGIPYVYSSHQTFSSDVLPDNKSALIYAKLRSDTWDEDSSERTLAIYRRFGRFRLHRRTVAKKLREIAKEQQILLRSWENHRDSEFSEFLVNPEFGLILSKFRQSRLKLLTYRANDPSFLGSHRTRNWVEIQKQIIMTMHGRAIYNLAYRIKTMTGRYQALSSTQRNNIEEKYEITPSAFQNTSGLVFAFAGLLASKASPQAPTKFDVDLAVRDWVLTLYRAAKIADTPRSSMSTPVAVAPRSTKLKNSGALYKELNYKAFWANYSA